MCIRDSSYIAAAVKAKVTLVEKHKLGGDCLNTGCVPSKALIRSAKLLSHIRRAPEFGIREAKADFDFAEVMQRVQRIIQTVEPHDSAERYTELGVEVIAGTDKMDSPWEVDIVRNDGKNERLSARSIVIATGARPFVPPIPGIEEVGYLTSDTVWEPVSYTHLDVYKRQIHYDAQAWQESFLANWPPGSPAWQSYYRRIIDGPEYTLNRASCYELTGETA